MLFLFPNGIINAIAFPTFRWQVWGKRGDKAISSRLGSRLEWKVNWDVADNSLTEKGWCHQFARLGLAALDSVSWIQQKTVETNLRLVYSNKKFFFLVFFSQNPVTKFFSYLFFLSTLILIFAVNYAVLLVYSKLSLGLRDHCIQGQTALSPDKAPLQCPEWVVVHQCHITVPVVQLCLSPCQPIEPVVLWGAQLPPITPK